MREYNDIVLLEAFSPNEIRNKILSSEVFFSKFYERNRQDELRELKIHLENAKHSGLFIDGGEMAVNILSKHDGDIISIFAGRNKTYFFKLYIDKGKQKTICYILINRS